jgi:CRP-like cAMP-binding protein
MNYRQLWSQLPDEVKSIFDQNSILLNFKRGDQIYHATDKPKGIYFIEVGLVGLLIIGSDSGKEHLLRFFKTSQFFGHRSLFSDEDHHGNAIALEPTKLRLVPRNIVLSVLDTHPELYKEITIVLAKELRRCELQRVMILENQILSRTAQALIYLKDLYPNHNWTRQEIANFCASTVSTVIKAMAELEAMNLISQKGRSIEIIDRDGLLNLENHSS